MIERTKSLKFKKRPVTTERVEFLREKLEDECKAQFIAWAEGTSLDTSGIWNGDPVFRPAICAWESWKAAWKLLSSNVEVRGEGSLLPKSSE